MGVNELLTCCISVLHTHTKWSSTQGLSILSHTTQTYTEGQTMPLVRTPVNMHMHHSHHRSEIWWLDLAWLGRIRQHQPSVWLYLLDMRHKTLWSVKHTHINPSKHYTITYYTLRITYTHTHLPGTFLYKLHTFRTAHVLNSNVLQTTTTTTTLLYYLEQSENLFIYFFNLLLCMNQLYTYRAGLLFLFLVYGSRGSRTNRIACLLFHHPLS